MFFRIFTPDRIQAAAIFLCGALGGGAIMNGHTTQNATAHLADVAGQRGAQVVHLEHKVQVLQKAVGDVTVSKTQTPIVKPSARPE